QHQPPRPCDPSDPVEQRPPRARHGRVRGATTWPAHDRREAVAGARAGAVLFVSPVFATRSHPGAGALGPVGAARVGRGLGLPMIALGGMTERRWRRIAHLGFHGWAAIDTWMGRPAFSSPIRSSVISQRTGYRSTIAPSIAPA
ncbi:MAG: hypothetical protein EOP68_26070, partial [Sphingomonas sp.]